MKVQILTKDDFSFMTKAIQIYSHRLYKSSYNDRPYFEVWEIEKSDLNILKDAMYEDFGTWFCYSNGANRGTAYDFITINGVSVIAWLNGSKKDRFNCLTDYYKDCLGVTDGDTICAYSVYLAKTNGWSLSELWKKLEG